MSSIRFTGLDLFGLRSSTCLDHPPLVLVPYKVPFLPWTQIATGLERAEEIGYFRL